MGFRRISRNFLINATGKKSRLHVLLDDFVMISLTSSSFKGGKSEKHLFSFKIGSFSGRESTVRILHAFISVTIYGRHVQLFSPQGPELFIY